MKEDWERKIKEKDKVLDIGCFSGKKVLELSKSCENVYGMDINTKEFMPELKERLFFGDITKEIPLKTKFDWILLYEVLEHVSDDELALNNIYKSLKKNGKLILSTPKSVKYFEFWDPAWVRWRFGGNKHYHYTQKELFDKLNRSGFVIKASYVMGNWRWVVIRWINVFLKYGLNSKKQIKQKSKKGFCDWIILAEK